MLHRALPLFSCLLLVVSVGLATADDRRVSPDELLAGAALEVGPRPPALVRSDEVMALSDEMREFLDRHVAKRAEDAVKLKQLTSAVIDKGSFDIEYEEATRTAAQTFRTRRGNCLSYTIMFVVLARGVGINARFQEVEIPREWSIADDTYILNRHINIYVDLRSKRPKVVDFNIADFEADFDTLVVSDQRALAHFFNNLGVFLMQQGDRNAAFHAFRTAIAENDRSFAPAWDSLGTLYSRMGLIDHAEAAFLQALAVDGADLTAMNNLTVLYDRRGEPELAEHYRKKVTAHRLRNPYHRFRLARAAYSAGEYGEALDHLKYALRQHKEEDRFCALLSLVYLKMGEEGKSRQWMARAEKYAGSDTARRVYSAKIERLEAASR